MKHAIELLHHSSGRPGARCSCGWFTAPVGAAAAGRAAIAHLRLVLLPPALAEEAGAHGFTKVNSTTPSGAFFWGSCGACGWQGTSRSNEALALDDCAQHLDFAIEKAEDEAACA